MRLVFDKVKDEYRAALYRKVEHGKGLKTVRDTAKARNLRDVICGAFGTETLTGQAREVYNYVKSTEWGRDLK